MNGQIISKVSFLNAVQFLDMYSKYGRSYENQFSLRLVNNK